MRFAQIQGNRVHWVFEADEAPEFDDNIIILDITDYPQVQEGWGFVDDEFIDPAPTFEELKAAKADEIAAVRYTAANGSLLINGHTYDIGTDSRTAFLEAMAAIAQGGTSCLDWKTGEGFVHLCADEFVTMVNIVLAYRKACFEAERVALVQVGAATTEEELDVIEWLAPDLDAIISEITGGEDTGKPGVINPIDPGIIVV